MSSPSVCRNSFSSSSKRVKSSAKRSRNAGAPSPPSAATLASASRTWTTSSLKRSGASTLPSLGVMTWTTVAAASSRTGRSRSESATASSRTLRSKGRETSAFAIVSRNARSISLSMSCGAEGRGWALKVQRDSAARPKGGQEKRPTAACQAVYTFDTGAARTAWSRAAAAGVRNRLSGPGRELHRQHGQTPIDPQPAPERSRRRVADVGPSRPAAGRGDRLRPGRRPARRSSRTRTARGPRPRAAIGPRQQVGDDARLGLGQRRRPGEVAGRVRGRRTSGRGNCGSNPRRAPSSCGPARPRRG